MWIKFDEDKDKLLIKVDGSEVPIELSKNINTWIHIEETDGKLYINRRERKWR